MKHKILSYGRLLLGITAIVLCGLAFYHHTYPIKLFDAQFVAALQSGLISGLGLSLFLLLTIIVVTLLFGRVYCSILCPLGLYQELLTVCFKPFYKKRKPQTVKHYVFPYFLAAVLFGALCGGTVVFIRIIDPYSIAGNAMSGAWLGLSFVVALTVLVLFKKRFFCTNICPVGAVLGFISRFSLFKIRMDNEKCKTCSLCARTCPCDSIDFKNHTVNNETCVKCFKCLTCCRHGALSYGLPPTKPEKFSSKRRELLTAGAVLLLFGAAFKTGIALSKKVAGRVKNVILPAGAKNAESFANRCLNCNLCVRNCPQSIIKPATKEIPFVHLDYNAESYCLYNCHKCSEVCPSGAIARISLNQKQKTKIANAVINEDVCVKCGICALECPKQIIIKEEDEYPLINFDKCIGCGKCATVCPVKAIHIAFIDSQNVR